MKSLLWRIGLTLCVFIVAGVFLTPALYNAGRSVEPAFDAAGKRESSFWTDTRINLGLDLKGGIHLTLGVDVDKALDASLAQSGRSLAAIAGEKGILLTRPRLAGADRLEFTLVSPAKKNEFDLVLKEFHILQTISERVSGDGKVRYVVSFTPAYRAELTDMTVDQALTTIRNRIDQFGVAEPDVRKQQGENRIIIQLPGVDDTRRAVDIIGKTAHLEFRMVRDDVDVSSRVPPVGVLMFPLEARSESGESRIAVESEVVMTGEHIANAVPRYDEYGLPFVSLSFDRIGSDQFAELTRNNVGRRMAIILDGKVHSAPIIKQEIRGDASINGQFTPTEANDLAVVLRAGSLPAPVRVLEERTVGPSLGQESIDKGVTAALVGGLAVIVFMIAYYGRSGIIADLMLLLDIMLILAGMAVFGATMTLPGIAGIVLTLGMAVDANVLVFERIREELGRGLTPGAAVDAGFSRAMVAILDSNLTTIIAAAILYQFGSGPVRGFAVTLTLGILASMFTAVFVSRIIFDMWMRKPGRKLSI